MVALVFDVALQVTLGEPRVEASVVLLLGLLTLLADAVHSLHAYTVTRTKTSAIKLFKKAQNQFKMMMQSLLHLALKGTRTN